jgi:hypothetical protein
MWKGSERNAEKRREDDKGREDIKERKKEV